MAESGTVNTGTSRALIALSIGLSAGAVAVGVYAYAVRIPAGQTGRYLAPAAHLLLGSMIAVAVVAAAIVATNVRVAAGRSAAVGAAGLLAVVTTVTAFAYLSTFADEHAALISGPGARPVIALAQLSWLLLTVAAVLLLAAATAIAPTNPVDPRRPTTAAFTATGLVLALAALLVVGATNGRHSHAITAAPVAVPDVPQTFGGRAAYRFNVPTNTVLPAGPGFVTTTKDAIVGYDGVTGNPRWQFPLTNLPADCTYDTLRSTGTVVIAACNRALYRARHHDYAFLVGLDAMTGRLMWVNDQDWRLQDRGLVSAQTVAVQGHKKFGALDAQTGQVTWSRDRVTGDCTTPAWYGTVGNAVVALDPCTATLHVVTADADSTIDLHIQPGRAPGQSYINVAAVDGHVVAVEIEPNTPDPAHPSQVMSIDTQTGSLRATAGLPLSSADATMPGPVLQIAQASGGLELYVLADGSVVHAPLRLPSISRDTPTSQRWVQVGDQFGTATARADEDWHFDLLTVSAQGTVSRSPSPCDNPAGLVPVPGALLVVCTRSAPNSSSYDIIGLR